MFIDAIAPVFAGPARVARNLMPRPGDDTREFSTARFARVIRQCSLILRGISALRHFPSVATAGLQPAQVQQSAPAPHRIAAVEAA